MALGGIARALGRLAALVLPAASVGAERSRNQLVLRGQAEVAAATLALTLTQNLPPQPLGKDCDSIGETEADEVALV
jgi:hypothetical protein